MALGIAHHFGGVDIGGGKAVAHQPIMRRQMRLQPRKGAAQLFGVHRNGGLTFGASVRNDQIGTGGTANGDSTVYISGAFGKLTMGDTGNAADSLVGQVSGVGYTSLGSMNEIGWAAKDTTGAQYEYSAGALTFALGLGQANATEDFISAAVKYSTDAYSVALGYEDNNGGSEISALGSATFSGATVKAKIVNGDFTPDTAYALSVDYAISGANVTAFYTDHGFDNSSAYGLGASYDLGGGASVAGGIVDGDVSTGRRR